VHLLHDRKVAAPQRFGDPAERVSGKVESERSGERYQEALLHGRVVQDFEFFAFSVVSELTADAAVRK
jgi:hypothetical protein